MKKESKLHTIRNFLLFSGAILCVFYLTFHVVDRALRDTMFVFLQSCTVHLSCLLRQLNAAPLLHDLIIDGVCPGVSSVLSFIPTIGCLFFCLSILSESGVLAWFARLMDRPMAQLDLPGQAVIPMVMGFGCSVPAILATDAISCKRQRYLTMLLIPYMSCSAKLPIYGMLAAAFFPENPLAAIGAIYLIGIFTGLLCAVLLKHIAGKALFASLFSDNAAGHGGSCADPCTDSLAGARHDASPVPTRPLPARILFPVLSSCLGFIKKAFTVILFASIAIWFLQNFDLQFHMTDDSSHSILAALGQAASPLFSPLGFDDWRAASALIAGISAKEAVISTLSILSEATSGIALSITLSQIFTPVSAFSFMVFCLLYVPCIATLAVIRKQTGKLRFSLLVLLGQTCLAWLAAFLVCRLLILFCGIF